MRNKQQLATSATRAAAVVFGVYLSAQAVFQLDPEYSGQSVLRVASYVSDQPK